MTTLDLEMSFRCVSFLRFYQAIGLAFLFVPINTLAYVGIEPGKNNDVSGLANLARNIGGSAGTSLFTTVLARHQQVHQQYLAANVYGSSPAWLNQYHALIQQSLQHTASLADAQRFAMGRLYQILQAQASVLSYIDVILILSAFCACMAPMALLLKKPPKHMEAAVH